MSKIEEKQIKEQLELLRKETQKNLKLCEEIEAMLTPVLKNAVPEESKEASPTQIVPLATEIRNIRFEVGAANLVMQSILERSEL